TAAGTRAYYQLNHWTEPPARRVDTLMAERLARSGAFRSVATSTDGVKGSLVLSLRLEELYHDASSAPGLVRISMTAVLSDPARHTMTEKRSFVRSAPAATYDAAGAVGAFDAALGSLLDDVTSWAGAAAAQRSSVASF